MCTNCMQTSGSPGIAGPTWPSVSGLDPVVRPAAPMAAPIDLTPNPLDPTPPLPVPGLPGQPQLPGPVIPPIPPFKLCHLDFRDGCYAITIKQTGNLTTFEGTLRVDRAAPNGGSDKIIVSGDLYSKPPVTSPIIPVPVPVPTPTPDAPEVRPVRGGATDDAGTATATARSGATALADAPVLPPLFAEAPSVAATVTAAPPIVAPILPLRPNIPIFPRARYHSYLKVTSVSVPVIAPSTAACQVTLVADQFNYTPPPQNQHKGTFPTTPSRTITMKLTAVPAPFPFSLTGGPYYEGRLLVNGMDRGVVTVAWVSRFLRRATVEIDTLAGAVAPAPVPNGMGGTDFFDTIFARTGWDLRVINDQTNLPVPPGVTPTNCWSDGNLHGLLTSHRSPTTDLDREWRIHLVVVPAKLGCGRGVMYDQIGVPREGCASFSDDGYPSNESSSFGAAANKKQRDVPRAFLRSATHEITHTLNQIHQEQETSADNSIMTTTPSVANVLGGPNTGLPGVFPDQIDLNHNPTVRNHLNHMPDPVIRPGGWPFASWFPAGAPQASDRYDFSPSEVNLDVTCAPERVALGQPIDLSWTMTNTSGVPLVMPNDVSTEALYATITVTDGNGREQVMRPFVIRCETATLEVLSPGASVSASTRLFWSSAGFAFERPGRYYVNVTVAWAAQGVLVGASDGVDVFVEFPTNDADNEAAGLAMHAEVGQWVALGGEAYHLPEATKRLADLAGMAGGDSEPRIMEGFRDLLPNMERAVAMYPELADSPNGTEGTDGGSTRRRRPRRPRRR